MDFLRAFIGIAVVIGLALLLGKTHNAKHPATRLYLWLFSISVLLFLRWCL